jgi:hypothetical protein
LTADIILCYNYIKKKIIERIEMISVDNNWSKIPIAEIDSFIKALNNIKNVVASDSDFTEIETFLWSIGYPIIYNAAGHYNEYIAETSGNREEV